MKALKNMKNSVQDKVKDVKIPGISSHEVEKDNEFDELVQVFKADHTTLKKFDGQITSFGKNVKDVAKSQQEAAEAVSSAFGSGKHGETVAKQLHSAQKLGAFADKAAERLAEYLRDPLAAHLEQYTVLEKRIKEREKRAKDLSEYKSHLVKLENDKKADQMKLKVARVKVEHTTPYYNKLNDELKGDLRKLHEETTFIFEAVLANWVEIQAEYYEETRKLYAELEEATKSVDKKGHLHREHVITPDDKSAMKEKNVEDD